MFLPAHGRANRGAIVVLALIGSKASPVELPALRNALLYDTCVSSFPSFCTAYCIYGLGKSGLNRKVASLERSKMMVIGAWLSG